MRTKLNYQWLEELYQQNKSYKEIAQITNYTLSSVNGYFYRTKGKMPDRNKYRRQTIPITQIQQEILFGVLMGDGWLTKVINSYQGRVNHSIKQEQYCIHLEQQLQPLTYGCKCHDKYTNNKKYREIYFCLKPNTNLQTLYDMFYQPKKHVPNDLTLLTPRAMAYWFMDDGTASSRCSISIATCSFSYNDLKRLVCYLKQQYDLDVTIQKDFKLYFSAESGRKFYNLVKPYIIPEMQYKFKYVM